jgi:hypothetical protein
MAGRGEGMARPNLWEITTINLLYNNFQYTHNLDEPKVCESPRRGIQENAEDPHDEAEKPGREHPSAHQPCRFQDRAEA